jgi:ubiquinone biosynthesis protein UbiJ
MELAEHFCRSLRQINIDWEGYLSQYTGSLIAGEISKAIGFAGYWGDHITATLTKDVQELLQHETSFLPGRDDIASFGSQVEQLQKRLEKLQLQINTIQNNKS